MNTKSNHDLEIPDFPDDNTMNIWAHPGTKIKVTEIIYSIAIGLEYILEELQKIRRLLECLNAPPFHINCRHQIIKNEEE